MKYLSCAETAKLVRQALKEAYPGIKFKVNSKTYAGGASINVRYEDGPAVKNVEAVIAIFEGSYFDGMQDYKGLNFAAIDGQEVRFGADFIFVNRDLSDALVAQAIDKLYADYAGNFKNDDEPKATVPEFRNGLLFRRYVPGLNGYFSLQEMIYRAANEIGADAKPANYDLLKRVKSLGDDGYGYGCTGRIAA